MKFKLNLISNFLGSVAEQQELGWNDNVSDAKHWVERKSKLPTLEKPLNYKIPKTILVTILVW